MFNQFARHEDAFREWPRLPMTHHGGLLAFPPGFSAHWIRLTADADCTANATLFYQ